MSCSEIMTIHFGSFRNFTHYYLFYVKEHVADLFPEQLSYNRFVELGVQLSVEMMLFLQVCCFGSSTGISFVDSTCISVCHNKRIKRNRVFKDYAVVGKSTVGWYFGFKLHFIVNERGEVLNFMLTKANVEVADTVGAGDSFAGTFTAAILSGKPIREAHELAVKVSAYVCIQKGAMPRLPEKFTSRIRDRQDCKQIKKEGKHL